MLNQNAVVVQLVCDERRIGRAIAEGDVRVLDELLADDFVGTTPDGTVLAKADVIGTLFSPAYDIDTFENADIDVRVHGDAAVVIARGIVQGRYNGQDASGQFRYTRVWTLQGERWRAVAAHSSMLPAKTAL